VTTLTRGEQQEVPSLYVPPSLIQVRGVVAAAWVGEVIGVAVGVLVEEQQFPDAPVLFVQDVGSPPALTQVVLDLLEQTIPPPQESGVEEVVGLGRETVEVG